MGVFSGFQLFSARHRELFVEKMDSWANREEIFARDLRTNQAVSAQEAAHRILLSSYNYTIIPNDGNDMTG